MPLSSRADQQDSPPGLPIDPTVAIAPPRLEASQPGLPNRGRFRARRRRWPGCRTGRAPSGWGSPRGWLQEWLLGSYPLLAANSGRLRRTMQTGQAAISGIVMAYAG